MQLMLVSHYGIDLFIAVMFMSLTGSVNVPVEPVGYVAVCMCVNVQIPTAPQVACQSRVLSQH